MGETTTRAPRAKRGRKTATPKVSALGVAAVLTTELEARRRALVIARQEAEEYAVDETARLLRGRALLRAEAIVEVLSAKAEGRGIEPSEHLAVIVRQALNIEEGQLKSYRFIASVRDATAANKAALRLPGQSLVVEALAEAIKELERT